MGQYGQVLIGNYWKDALNLDPEEAERAVPPEEEDSPEYQQLLTQAWDDITGRELEVAKVREARRLD